LRKTFVKKQSKKSPSSNKTTATSDETPCPDYSSTLKALMVRVGLSNFKALNNLGIAKKQVQRLRRGEIQQLRLQTLFQLSQILKIPLEDLLLAFSPPGPEPLLTRSPAQSESPSEKLQALQQEYQRLQTQLQEQRSSLWQEFQQQSLQILESFLLQWPTAAYAARQNPTAPAVKLLPLARPIEQLLKSWGITPIGEVGKDVIYDPHWHEAAAGELITPGAAVQVRHVGYQQGERLIHRAKVSFDAVNPTPNS
jgi:molecular chaperone GrpE (heat shock protein)/DNA-binding Xre family transcriptional regulator